MPIRRRELLVLSTAAFASLAGCPAGGNSDGDGTTTPTRDDGAETPSTPESTPTPTPTPSPTPDYQTTEVSVGETVAQSVTVREVAVQQSVRHLTYPDAMGVYGPPDSQLVFATVSVSPNGDGLPKRDAFSLAVDGERYSPRSELNGQAVHKVRSHGVAYPLEDDEDPVEGFLLFEVPTGVSPDEAAVVFTPATELGGADEIRWTLSPDSRSALTPPYPDTEVVSVDVPESVSGDSIPVTLTVSNDGGRDGVLRGAINHQGPLYGAFGFDVPVPAGEERTVEKTVSYDWGDGGDIQFAVVWAGGTRGYTVQVE